MTWYRLYFFNPLGHIERFREFEAATDSAAAAQADGWRTLGAMELWSGRRKVRHWDALGLAPEARARAMLGALRAQG